MANNVKLLILISQAILRISLYFLFLVVLWTTLDIVKPSEKNSVRYNSSSHYIRCLHYIYTKTIPVKQVPAKHRINFIKFSTLQLFKYQNKSEKQNKSHISSKSCNLITQHSPSIQHQYHYTKYILSTNKITYSITTNVQRFLVIWKGKLKLFLSNSNSNRTSICAQPTNNMYQESHVNMEMDNPLHTNISSNSDSNLKRKNEDSTNTDQSQQNKILVVEESVQSTPMDSAESRLNMNWGELNSIIEPLRAIEYKFPDLSELQRAVSINIPDQDLESLLQRRENTSIDTMARELFDTWLMPHGVLEQITPYQHRIALQFIHILKQETCIDVQVRFQKEMQQFIALALPADVNLMHWEHKNATEACYTTAKVEMQNVIAALVEAAVAQFPKDWPEAPSPPEGEALEVLTSMIFQDMPTFSKEVQDEEVLLHNLTNISLSTHSVTQRLKGTGKWQEPNARKDGFFTERTLLTDAEVVATVSLKTYRANTEVDKYLANTTTHKLRNDGLAMGQVNTSHLEKSLRTHIQGCAMADRQAGHGQYTILSGFHPLPTLQRNINELNQAYEQIGLVLDLDWIEEMYTTNGWAVRRDHDQLHYTPGAIIKLRDRQLFGTTRKSSAINGNIFPLTAVLRSNDSSCRPKYFMLALIDPVDIEKIQMPTKYRSLFTFRDVPFDRDRNALTSAFIFDMRQVLLTLCGEHFTIISLFNYHMVYTSWVKTRNNYDVQEYLHQEDPEVNKNDHKLKTVPEIVFNVIYTGTEDGVIDGYDSPSFKMVQEQILSKLNLHGMQSPILFKRLGLRGEMLFTVQECIEMPRRHQGFKTDYAVFIHGIPANCLAEHLLFILAESEPNQAIIPRIEGAVILPAVKEAIPPLPHRLMLIGGNLQL